jgi:hypothetical protein
MRASLRLVALALSLIGTIVMAQAPLQSNTLYICSGILRSMDKEARTITIDLDAVPQKFVVPTDAVVIPKDKPQGGTLSDLMIGDNIQVKYTVDDGVNVAHQILLLGVKSP